MTIACASDSVPVERLDCVFGTPYSGSQQGGQNRRLAFNNQYAAWRVQVPEKCGGCIQSIIPWLRWSEPSYGAGTFGSFSLGVFSDTNGLPGNLLTTNDARTIFNIINNGETYNNNGESAFPEMQMGGNYCPEAGDCFWIVVHNTDPDPNDNNFSLNGLQIRPRNVLQNGWPEMDCQRYVEGSDGSGWSDLTGSNFEMLPFFCIELTSGKRWGMPYSVSDANVYQLNNADGNFSAYAINGTNRWRTQYTTTVPLTNASLKFFGSRYSGTAPLTVTVNGTTYTVPASSFPTNSLPGTSTYFDGNNWPQIVIPLGNLPAGTHTVEWSTQPGTEYTLGMTGVLPGTGDCEAGGTQHTAELNQGAGWNPFLLWSGLENTNNRIQGYICGQV